MTAIPVVVVFSKQDIVTLSDLITEEKDRIVASKNEWNTSENLDAMTVRLRQLVSALTALNEGMVTAIEYSRELKEQEKNGD